MIEKLSAVCADIDGTLCEKGGQLYPCTKEAIEALHHAGILFGLGTGRAINQRVFTMKDFWGLSFDFDFIIGMNGGQLWTKEDPAVEDYHLLSCEMLKEIIERMRPMNLNAVIYEDEHMVATRMDIFQEASMKRNHTQVIVTDGDEARLYVRPNNNILFRYDPEEEEKVLKHAKELSNERYIGIRTAAGCLEFMDPRVNKGDVLKNYAEKAGLDIKAIMAFGDNDNDAQMLKEAGWGVCLKDGSPLCRSMADAITEYECTQDGVGRYLYDHCMQFLKPDESHCTD